MIIKEIKNPDNKLVSKIFYNEENDISVTFDEHNNFCILQDGETIFADKKVLSIINNEVYNIQNLLNSLNQLWDIYIYNKPSNKFEECFDSIYEIISEMKGY